MYNMKVDWTKMTQDQAQR